MKNTQNDSRKNAFICEIASNVAAACLIIFLCFAPGLVLTYLAAIQEAASFNKLTNGPKVTTWDAIWLDLRVEAK